jgi:hypothetical protein
MTIRIEPIADSAVADEALEALLQESHVGGGFPAPDVADSILRAASVRWRNGAGYSQDGDICHASE